MNVAWAATLGACLVLLFEMGTFVPLAIWFFAIAGVFFYQQFSSGEEE